MVSRKVISLLVLFGAIVAANAQKRKGSEEEDNQLLSKDRMRGTCSCREMEAQMDALDRRLDRMIDLWNDFVDKNRDPYQSGGVPGRRPPGRGPYFERDRQPQRPMPRPGGRNMGRDSGDYDQERRFKF